MKIQHLRLHQVKNIIGGNPDCWDDPNDDDDGWPIGGSTGPYNPFPDTILGGKG